MGGFDDSCNSSKGEAAILSRMSNTRMRGFSPQPQASLLRSSLQHQDSEATTLHRKLGRNHPEVSFPFKDSHCPSHLPSSPRYWRVLSFPSPGDLPDPGIEPVSPALAGRFFTTELPRKPGSRYFLHQIKLR